MTTSAAVASSSSSQEFSLASCALVSHRVEAALADDSVIILHRTQWQCLSKTYSEVLRALTDLLQDDCSLISPPKLKFLLHALLRSIQDAERCIEDCMASRLTFTHSWLLDKALILGPSTDIVNVHLHDFLWTFSAMLNQVTLQLDSAESDVVLLARTLSDIWACEDAEADLSEACNFLSTIKVEEEGDTSLLADFILHKLRHAQDLENVDFDALPSYLWIDANSLTRNPEVLGLGGYGKVHEAGWLGGRFAVKDFFYMENNMVFGREAAIQARLRHPNVISLVCCTKNPSLHKCSLVMELMQQDLRILMIDRIAAGMDPPFSLGVAVDLMTQIAHGMEYLHRLHIMHRDLKSSNILVGFSRRKCDADMNDVGPCAYLKIADFGMSKAKHASSKYTTRQVGATPWRAPEVFDINPEDEVEGDIDGKYTKKADVYSFGLVCYEILTGKSPFEGAQVRKRVLAGERPLLPSYCPQALSSFIERCWCAEPSRRPPFSQIGRILRYFKACIFPQEQHDQSLAHHSWLSHPLFPDVCAQIDDMVISLVQRMGTPLQLQPVNILLEMHCCRVVLKERESASDGCANDAPGITIMWTGVESSNLSPQTPSSTSELHQNDHGHCKSSSKAKSYSNYVSRSLKKIFCLQSTDQLAKSELLDALGLVRDYTFEELRLATADFSRVLGEGGTGKVFYGMLEDGREIAVKTAIRPKVSHSGRIVSTSETIGLVQELRIAGQLRHRNIVPLFGWCQDQGKLLLVYKFMPNGDLARHIFGERNGLNWQQTYKVICQLASALKYLHQDSGYLQIVHRDVKAGNVLLDSRWNACLGDCGLAVLLRNGNASYQSLAGTFGYIAPESVTQNTVSPASDVYAFGITVLEVATRRRAYTMAAMGDKVSVQGWVWKLYQRGDLMKAANARLGGKFVEVEMRRLLLLGLSCTSADPYLRPSIEEVIKILSGASEPPSLGAQSTQLYPSAGMYSSTLAATSTGSFWGSPTYVHLSRDGNKESGALTHGIVDKLQQISKVRVFTFKELKAGTRNFRRGNTLGEGGFGHVYKCSIKELGPTGAKVITVAVKMLHAESAQGHKEWLAEVEFLGQLHHPNLVKLIGYCSENEHQLLVYEFMPNGSLENHLFTKAPNLLSWATRVRIALGAAKGVAFLHDGAKPSVIHRDLKTSNILMDWDFTAKLSDFGLAKHGPQGDRTHVSTRVMGTYGYAAPEYVATGHLTWRSDVYNFGVVLLELLTGLRSFDKTRAIMKQNLVVWARPYLCDKHKCLQIMDPSLDGTYSLKGAEKAAALALSCLSNDANRRPPMRDAVQILESLQ